MSKQVNSINNEFCMETGLPPGKYNEVLLTLLVLVKLTSSFPTIHYNAGYTYIHYKAGAG